MKRIIYSFLAIMTLWACSEENLEKVGCEGCDAPEGTVKVNAQFVGRTLAPKTYAGTYPADVAEKSISDVRIFVFSDNGGQPKTLLGSEVVTNIKTGDTEVGVNAIFFMRYFGEVHLVATANVKFSQDKLQKMYGQNFDKFSHELVTQPAGVANKFPMTSEIVDINIPDPQTSSATPSVSFLLERLSARIDIENETTTSDGGEFVLTGARLENTIDRSFLVKGQAPALTIGNTEYGALAIPLGDWKENTGVNGDKKKMYMQLYAYENVKNTLTVQVKGTFKGQPAQFSLPFGEQHAVKRNFRYVVKIQNVAGNRVNFTVNVVDWDEGGDIIIKPGLDGSAPIITKIEPATSTGATTSSAHNLAYSTGTNPNDANMITLTKPSVYHTKITVESPSTEATILVNKAEVPWVSVKQLGQSNISGGKLIQEFLVTYAGSQDLYGRTAELELQNKFKPDKQNRHLITVKQPKATTTNNHLARFANANVGELNEFADVITPDNLTDYDNLGKYYQWGRNISFTNTTVLVTTEEKSNGNDALLWSNKMMTTTTGTSFNWHKNGKANETWTDVVAQATKAPISYKGTNGGDPSPKGYRLPNKEEMQGVVPRGNSATLNFKGSVSKKDVEEKITIKGVSADYKADYYSTTPNVIYALKMKDASNANLTAYRYEYKGERGLWITSRLLGAAGATVKVEDIANKAFWNDATKGGSDVIRYIPSMGIFSYYQGTLVLRGSGVLLATMTSMNKDHAYDLGYTKDDIGLSGISYGDRKAYTYVLRPIKK